MYKFGFNLTMCLIQLCVNSKRTLELSTKKNIKLTESSTQADFLFKHNQVTHHFEKCYHTLCCLCNSYFATVTDGDLQDCAARAREVRQYFSKWPFIQHVVFSKIPEIKKNRKLSNINYAHVGNPSLIAFHQNIHHKPHVTLHSGQKIP